MFFSVSLHQNVSCIRPGCSISDRGDWLHGKLSVHVCWIVSEQEVRQSIGREDLGILDACRLSKGAWSVKDEGRDQGSLKTTAMPRCCSPHGRASPILLQPSWCQVHQQLSHQCAPHKAAQLECSLLGTSGPPACQLIFPTRTCGPWEHSLGHGLFRIHFPMFRKMILRFTHIVTCLSNLFHFSAEQYFIVWLSRDILIQTSVDEHLSWLWFGTMIINLLWPFLCMLLNGCMFSFD